MTMDGVSSRVVLIGSILAFLFGMLAGAFGGGAAPPCPESMAIPMVNVGGIKTFENKSVLYEDRVYPPDHYWWNEKAKMTMGCICQLGVTCLRKCCKDRQALEVASCVDIENDEEDPPELELLSENLSPDLRNGSMKLRDHFYLVKNRICPNNVFFLEPEKTPIDKFVLDAKGTLRTEEITLTADRFCIDWKMHNRTEVTVIVCYLPSEQPVHKIPLEMRLYPTVMIISIFFLLATLFVYAIIPELKNLYGKTLICYIVCLIIAYSFLAVVQLTDVDQFIDTDQQTASSQPTGDNPTIDSDDLICISFAFTIYFSFLASFFWLNVMCFDIWWTFGGFRSLQGSVKQRERKKFILYSIYAWGCAITWTIICIIMDFVPGIPDFLVRPEFGVNSCWFKTETAKAVYFYGPMGITVICNIILFVSTAIKILQHKKDTAHQLKGSDSRRHNDNKQWFNLYLKLFIVMGINWSMEIISWLVQGPKALWYVTDLGNALQGVIIFIIFVCKEKIKRLLIKRFWTRNPNFLSRDSTSRTTCTTSIPLHEKTSSYPDPRAKSTRQSYDDSDGA